MVKYICDKCGREFDRKSTYDFHINRKFSCIKESNEIVFTYTELKEEYNKLQNKFIIIENENIFLKEKIDKIKNEELEDKISKANYKFQQLENENKTINELYKCLLDKCLDKTIKNKKISNKNCNNIINNTINNINVKLVPFGMENLDDLTSEEKKTILNAGMFCSVMCAKKLNCNPRLPQYQNIAFTNLRSNDAKIFDKDKTWKTVDKEDLFETVIPRRIDDVNLLIENEEIKISPYMENLIKKGTEEDEVVKDEKVKKRFHRTVYDFNQNKNKTTITK